METVVVERNGPVAVVTLNRPDRHNAMTPTMIKELAAVFTALSDDGDARVVILTGQGRSFCAGADLSFMRAAADYTMEENIADGEAIFDLMLAVDRCSKPVIGRVNGAAIGGGMGLVSCCDCVVAVEQAQFAFSEVRLGIVAATISPFVLAKVPPSQARELLLTGERFTAHHARHVGLVHHVVADEAALDAKVEERVAAFLKGAPGAQAIAKALIKELAGQKHDELRARTSRLIAERRASDEGREGMSAFLEKREPWWQS
jgi:methylglutaconyl-CoA hydratase